MGTRLSALRSDASHCRTQRMKKMPCPKKPIASHIASVLGMSDEGRAELKEVEGHEAVRSPIGLRAR